MYRNVINGNLYLLSDYIIKYYDFLRENIRNMYIKNIIGNDKKDVIAILCNY